MARLADLIVHADRHPTRIDTMRTALWAPSFLAVCFVCHLISQKLDRVVLKGIGELIHGDTA